MCVYQSGSFYFDIFPLKKSFQFRHQFLLYIIYVQYICIATSFTHVALPRSLAIYHLFIKIYTAHVSLDYSAAGRV